MERKIVIIILVLFLYNKMIAQQDSNIVYDSYIPIWRFAPMNNYHVGFSEQNVILFDKSNIPIFNYKSNTEFFWMYVNKDSIIKMNNLTDLVIRNNKLKVKRKNNLLFAYCKKNKISAPIFYGNYIIGLRDKKTFSIVSAKISDNNTINDEQTLIEFPKKEKLHIKSDNFTKFVFFDNKLAIYEIDFQTIYVFDKNLNLLRKVNFESDDYKNIYWDYVYDNNNDIHYSVKIFKKENKIEIYKFENGFNEMVLKKTIPNYKIIAINGDKIYYTEYYTSKGTTIRFYSFSNKYNINTLEDANIE